MRIYLHTLRLMGPRCRIYSNTSAAQELAGVLSTAYRPDGAFIPGSHWGPMQIAAVSTQWNQNS
eukprot:14033-Prorocentrum_minimum.AAC.1